MFNFCIQVNMKFEISTLSDQLKRLECATKYGTWFTKNAVYFDQFLNLRQENLTVDECIEEFSRLHCICKLKRQNYDFDRFLRGLRPDILKNMRDCNDIFEGYQEAILFWYKIRWSRMRKSKSAEGKSQKTTRAHVMEPVAENMKLDIEKSEEETKNSKTSVEVTCTTHEECHISNALEAKEIDSIENMDLKVQEVKKDEERVIDIPHIDFIFGDRLLVFEDYDPLIYCQQLMHPTVSSQTNDGFRN